jgi:hypothetical protein
VRDETSQVNTKKGELGNWALFHEVGIQSDAFSTLSTDNRAKMQNESLAKQRPKNMRNALAHSNGKCERKVSQSWPQITFSANFEKFLENE